MHVSQNPPSVREEKPIIIGFSRQDSEGVIAHENDSMVIKVQIHDWSIKRVLIDLGSSTDILYWEAFKGNNMDTVTVPNFDPTHYLNLNLLLKYNYYFYTRSQNINFI